MRPQIEIPERQNQTLEPPGLAKPGNTRGSTGKGEGSACQDVADRVSGWFWNQTEQFLLSEPALLAGYPDPLLTLAITTSSS